MKGAVAYIMKTLSEIEARSSSFMVLKNDSNAAAHTYTYIVVFL